MTRKPDHYEVLGVRPDADPEVIAAAYKALAKKYHPDSGKRRGTDSVEHFRAVQEAYDVLGDKESRQRYDAERLAEKTNEKGGSFDAGSKPDASASAHKPQSSSSSDLRSLRISFALIVSGVAAGAMLLAMGLWQTNGSNKPITETSAEAQINVSETPISTSSEKGSLEGEIVYRDYGTDQSVGKTNTPYPPLPMLDYPPKSSSPKLIRDRIVGNSEVMDNVVKPEAASQIILNTYDDSNRLPIIEAGETNIIPREIAESTHLTALTIYLYIDDVPSIISKEKWTFSSRASCEEFGDKEATLEAKKAKTSDLKLTSIRFECREVKGVSVPRRLLPAD